MAQNLFEDRVVFISGAGRGLGKRAAERFAEEGARLVISDHEEAAIAPVVQSLLDKGHEAVGHWGDVADESTLVSAAGLARSSFGGLDIAINNAGIAQGYSRLHEIDSDFARKVIEVDLLGVFFAMKHQVPLLLERVAATGRQGVIVNIASAAGIMGAPLSAAYSAAKHGVVGLTRTAAKDYGRKGLRINCICPAFTRTEMVMKPLSDSPHGAEAAEAKMVAYNPMQRLGEIDEIVQAMIWASSPENSFFNGHALPIDGGLSA